MTCDRTAEHGRATDPAAPEPRIWAGNAALFDIWDSGRGPLNAVEAAQYVVDAAGLPLTPWMFRSLASVGRGPRCWRGGYPADCMYEDPQAIEIPDQSRMAGFDPTRSRADVPLRPVPLLSVLRFLLLAICGR